MAFEPKKNGVLKTLLSVLAAMFGVQSERKRNEDFSSGKPWHYLLLGLLMAFVFVIFVMFLVRWALSLGGA